MFRHILKISGVIAAAVAIGAAYAGLSMSGASPFELAVLSVLLLLVIAFVALSLHLRALQWLLDDHVCAPPVAAPQFEAQFLLEIASTPMQAGRTGHAYALDGGPLGDPGADGARGSLLRFTRFALRRA